MFLTQLVFPRFCLGCGYIGCYICAKCKQKLVYNQINDCFYCKKPSLFGLTHPNCSRRDGIDGVISLYRYNDFLRKVIKSFKYRLAVAVWNELKLLIEPAVLKKIQYFQQLSKNQLTAPVYLQPIPLSPHRLNVRGFNQASLLTEFFQSVLKLPAVDLLKRVIDTKPQAEINNWRDRWSNVRDAIKLSTPIKSNYQQIILVDDVITSGHTICTAAKTLKQAGVEKVYGLTLAKG